MNVFVEFLGTLALSAALATAAYFAALSSLTRNTRGRWFLRRSGPGRSIDYVFGFLTVGYIVVFTTLSVLRYLSFNLGDFYINSGWDLGLYGQSLWNSLNGRLLENSFIPDATVFLAKSFSPILVAFVPLYAVTASPIVFLVVQTIALGLAALPIYWFARERLGRVLALAVGLVYFLSPAVQNMNLTQFHEIALETTVFAFALFFLMRRHYRGFLICLGIGFLVKEEVAFIAVGLGAYVSLVQRKWTLGLAISALGLVWGILLLQFGIPFFRDPQFGRNFYYFDTGLTGGGGARYGYLGHSLPEILVTIFTRPQIVLEHLTPEKAEFVLHLLVPLAFVPLVGAEVTALALPTLGYSVLSVFGPQYSIRFFYFAPILPFLFFGSVVGLERLLQWHSQGLLRERMARQSALVVLLVVAAASSYFLNAPGPFARYFQTERYLLNAHTSMGNALLGSIPGEATVAAEMDLLAHLSGRTFVYEIPAAPDYRLIDYLVADTTSSWYNVHRGYWDYFLSTGYFEIVVQQDGYLVARRVSPAHAVNFKFADEITLLGYTIAPTATLQGGMTLRPIVEWRAERPVSERYLVEVQVVDALGHIWAVEDREPDGGLSPTVNWRVGRTVGDQHSLRLPPTMPAGDYELTLALHEAAGNRYLDAYDEYGRLLGSAAVLARVRIEKNKSSFTASDLMKEQPFTAHFVDMGEMRFLGYVPPRESIRPGEPLSLGLYWRARGKPQGDYIVAVHLRDATGGVSFEHAARPAHDTYPTTQWDAGEVLLDWHDFVVPPDLTAGEYRLAVVLRNSASGEPLGEAFISSISVVN